VPRVSVIIPTHNRASMVREAMESVSAQTFQDWDLLVVDDGSTDDTERYLATVRSPFRYVRTPHRGVSAARNTGIDITGGEWIAFLDSDDLWLPRKLERQLRALRAGPPVSLCYTDEIWIRNGRRVNPRERHRKHSGWIFERCLPLCIISPSSALIHRKVLEDVGGFDETLPACEDYDLWLRITLRYAVRFLEEKLIIKRGGHSDQLSQAHWGMDRFRVRALSRILGDSLLTESQSAIVREELERKCTILAQGARKRGLVTDALLYARVGASGIWEDEEDGSAISAGSHGGRPREG
jgi:glycosyltransferase involved in cell wall biosynthesis